MAAVTVCHNDDTASIAGWGGAEYPVGDGRWQGRETMRSKAAVAADGGRVVRR